MELDHSGTAEPASEAIPESGHVGWVEIVMLCGIVILLDGYDLAIAALILPVIANDWALAPAAFGTALSATAFGLAIGAAFIAPMGDHLGRRPVIIGSFAIIGLTSLGVAFCDNLTEFTLLRFVTGIGLGACQANAFAMVSEWAPPHIRLRLTTAVAAMAGLGAVFAGLILPVLLALGSWPAAFLFGGILPVLITGILLLRLRESPDFSNKARSGDSAAAVNSRRPGGWKELLSIQYRRSTLIVWLLFFMTAFCSFYIGSWLPTLMRNSGWSIDAAAQAITVFSLGGTVTALGFGWMADRISARPALIASFVLTIAALVLLSVTPSEQLLWYPLIAIMGAGAVGGYSLLPAACAQLYPAKIRATGIGTGTAISRIGATLAPITGAGLLGLGLGTGQMLLFLLVPMGIAVAVSLLLRSAAGVECRPDPDRPNPPPTVLARRSDDI